MKGRSQADITNNMQVKEALESERNWFSQHPIYAHLPNNKCGTGA